ncbi:unnamed protein product [Leptidea sinapis]|uniref:FLYWCH-type domain-containing protein n=1 Tax=Leptidea sinapis TaxID=189913 RepID=A0A5E4Q0B2_9NEOP|nr:unnamed protein product [Leptidea sinapis]
MNGSVHWVCANKRKTQCPGSVTILYDIIIREVRHRCEPDYRKNEIKRKKAKHRELQDLQKKISITDDRSTNNLLTEKEDVEYITGLHFVTSCRGNPMIVHNGFNFIRERFKGERTRWVCGRKRRNQCCASLTTIGDTLVRTYGIHNHS